MEIIKHQPALDPNNMDSFIKLDGVETKTATDVTDFIANVRANLKRNLKGIQHIPGFQQIKGNEVPIALVGGGPSVKNQIEKLKDFKLAGFPIIACGSAHDWLIGQGVIPTFCTACDPDPIMAEYLKKWHKDVKYMIALSCDKSVFDLLKECDVYAWNCRSDEASEVLKDEYAGYVDILGGCTVGLRSISIAMCFGFTNIHFFGFDSCMGSGDEHHAYEFETDKEEVGPTYPIRFGDIKEGKPAEGEKYYICSGYQLAQVTHFQHFLQHYGIAFTPTFHGEGLLPDFIAYLRRKAAEEMQTIKAS